MIIIMSTPTQPSIIQLLPENVKPVALEYIQHSLRCEAFGKPRRSVSYRTIRTFINMHTLCKSILMKGAGLNTYKEIHNYFKQQHCNNSDTKHFDTLVSTLHKLLVTDIPVRLVKDIFVLHDVELEELQSGTTIPPQHKKQKPKSDALLWDQTVKKVGTRIYFTILSDFSDFIMKRERRPTPNSSKMRSSEEAFSDIASFAIKPDTVIQGAHAALKAFLICASSLAAMFSSSSSSSTSNPRSSNTSSDEIISPQAFLTQMAMSIATSSPPRIVAHGQLSPPPPPPPPSILALAPSDAAKNPQTLYKLYLNDKWSQQVLDEKPPLTLADVVFVYDKSLQNTTTPFETCRELKHPSGITGIQYQMAYNVSHLDIYRMLFELWSGLDDHQSGVAKLLAMSKKEVTEMLEGLQYNGSKALELLNKGNNTLHEFLVNFVHSVMQVSPHYAGKFVVNFMSTEVLWRFRALESAPQTYKRLIQQTFNTIQNTIWPGARTTFGVAWKAHGLAFSSSWKWLQKQWQNGEPAVKKQVSHIFGTCLRKIIKSNNKTLQDGIHKEQGSINNNQTKDQLFWDLIFTLRPELKYQQSSSFVQHSTAGGTGAGAGGVTTSYQYTPTQTPTLLYPTPTPTPTPPPPTPYPTPTPTPSNMIQHNSTLMPWKTFHNHHPTPTPTPTPPPPTTSQNVSYLATLFMLPWIRDVLENVHKTAVIAFFFLIATLPVGWLLMRYIKKLWAHFRRASSNNESSSSSSSCCTSKQNTRISILLCGNEEHPLKYNNYLPNKDEKKMKPTKTTIKSNNHEKMTGCLLPKNNVRGSPPPKPKQRNNKKKI